MPKKNNISYIKPQEPAFLTRLKQQAGYKEGPSIDTKREQLPTASDESDGEDQPQVVVLKPGDLSKEEAEKAIKEVTEAPADLSKRVLFKKPVKTSGAEVSSSGQQDGRSSAKKRGGSSSSDGAGGKSAGKKQKHQKSLLSFDEDDGEEED